MPDHGAFSVEIHHIQGRQCLLRPLGVKKARGIELHGQLILAEPGVGALLFRPHLHIEQGGVDAHVHPQLHPLGPGLQAAVAKADKLHAALVSQYPEGSGQLVKLANQLNDQQAYLPESPIGCQIAVPAQLAPRLLHGRDGRGRGNAGYRAAGAHIPGAGDLLELVNLIADDRNVDVA